MIFRVPTLVEIPQNGTEKLCSSYLLGVTLAEASTALCDGAGCQLLLPQLQFAHQLPRLPQDLYFTAAVIAIANPINP